MDSHKVTVTIEHPGSLTLVGLPFSVGQTVEVTVVARGQGNGTPRYPLHGSVYRYDEPFEPAVAEEDWEALR